MNKPNKTPWRTDQYGNYVKCSQGKIICQFGGMIHDYSNNKVNSKRIVECVNALAGINNPAQHLQLSSDRIYRLTQEVNSLQGLLKTLCDSWDGGESISPTSFVAMAIRMHMNK